MAAWPLVHPLICALHVFPSASASAMPNGETSWVAAGCMPLAMQTVVLLRLCFNTLQISCHFMFGAEAKSLVLLQKSDTTMALLRAVACHESRGCRMVGHVTATVLCLKPPLQSASTMPSKGRPCEARILC